MPLVRVVLVRTAASPIVAAVKKNSTPPQRGFQQKKHGFATTKKKQETTTKKASKVDDETMAIPSQKANQSNVVAAVWRRRSTDEDDVEVDDATTTPSFYTMIGGHPENALARAPHRLEVTRTTIRELGLKEVLPPVWPPVSVFASDGPTRDVHDPTTRERLALIRSAKWAHVDAALTRAKKAQRRWATLSARTRVGIVREIDDEIKMRSQHLANLLVLEVGKVPSEASGEIVEIHEVVQAIVERVEECGGDAPYPVRQYASRDPRRAAMGWTGQERRLPLGVVGKITAFNFPYAPFAWGALPALAAGNAVVWKPHPHAVLTGMALARCVDDVLARHGFSGLVAAFDAGADDELVRKTW